MVNTKKSSPNPDSYRDREVERGKATGALRSQCLLLFFAVKTAAISLENIGLSYMISINPRGKMKFIFKKLDKRARASEANKVNNFV
jgi:hypothetical protein